MIPSSIASDNIASDNIVFVRPALALLKFGSATGSRIICGLLDSD
jgi:hypothetical protein